MFEKKNYLYTNQLTLPSGNWELPLWTRTPHETSPCPYDTQSRSELWAIPQNGSVSTSPRLSSLHDTISLRRLHQFSQSGNSRQYA